MLSSA
jgi:hypothetical protein